MDRETHLKMKLQSLNYSVQNNSQHFSSYKRKKMKMWENNYLYWQTGKPKEWGGSGGERSRLKSMREDKNAISKVREHYIFLGEYIS